MTEYPQLPLASYIIFDFDGTIADSLAKAVEICNRIAPEYKLRSITNEELKHCQNLPAKEVMKFLGISKLKLPFLVRRVQKELRSQISTLPLNPGIKECLFNLKEMGYRLGIVTSNSTPNVEAYLQAHGIIDAFEFIHSSRNLFGKHKVLRKVLKNYSINPEEVYYVGDECRDIEAAHKCNIKMISVTWGFSSKKIIQSSHPEFIAEKAEDITTFIRFALQQTGA
ncbi:HAD-IA family hydrolase [Limibacter armeniacum]|uniref:HAD-IA family hydrolase n=1 Tax=Limibacter armeniacum TaxID=466084 RepID=UPI002FE66998